MSILQFLKNKVLLKTGVFLYCTVLFVGCKSAPIFPVGVVEAIPIEREDWDGVVWVDEWIILHKGTDTVYEGTIWKVHPDGSGLEILNLYDDDDCEKVGVQSPTRLPNSNLGYIFKCGFDDLTKHIIRTMMEYDLSTGEIRPLLNYPFNSTWPFSWNPDMTRGISTNGSALYSNLFWFTKDAIEIIEIDFTSQVYLSDWSPRGDLIAFMAAKERGLVDIQRADSIFDLYLMEADGSDIRPLVTGIQPTTGSKWSPNGEWIVFGAKIEGQFDEQYGLWLLEVSSGKYKLLAPGRFWSPSWSPDADYIVALLPDESWEVDLSEPILIDVSEIIKDW